MVDFSTLGDIFIYLSAFFGAFFVALWLSLVLWTNQDIRSRSRDRFTILLATLLVLLLNLPGIAIYMILRPKNTLIETYQQTLEEEVLLREIEAKANCPGCGSQTDPDWQLCPYCHTRLHKTCSNCGRLMDLPWRICPYCAHEVPGTRRTSPLSSTQDDRETVEVGDAEP